MILYMESWVGHHFIKQGIFSVITFWFKILEAEIIYQTSLPTNDE